MNIILKILKQNNLSSIEFIKFLGISKSQFDYRMRKNDPIYIRGMERKLIEFIEFKIKQLQTTVTNLNQP